MKILYSIIFLALIPEIAKTQDQIITTEGKVIECEITELTTSLILFKLWEGGSSSNSAVNFKNVHSYYYRGNNNIINPLEDGVVIEQKPESIAIKKGAVNKLSKTFLFLNGGYGKYNTSEDNTSSEGLNSFNKSMQSGFFINSGFFHFGSNNSNAIGVKVHFLSTSANSEFIETRVTVNSGTHTGKYAVSGSQSLIFIGPSFKYRIPVSNEGLTFLSFDISPGTFYSDSYYDIRFDSPNLKENLSYGKDYYNLAALFDVELHFLIRSNFYLGLGVHYFLNQIEGLQIIGSEFNRRNLNHWNVGLGLYMPI